MSNHIKRISKLATTLLLLSLLIGCSKDEEISPVTQNDPTITASPIDENPEANNQSIEDTRDLYYPDYEKKTVTFGWHQVRNPEDVTNLSKDELYKLLENSYQGFTMKK